MPNADLTAARIDKETAQALAAALAAELHELVAEAGDAVAAAAYHSVAVAAAAYALRAYSLRTYARLIVLPTLPQWTSDDLEQVFRDLMGDSS